VRLCRGRARGLVHHRHCAPRFASVIWLCLYRDVTYFGNPGKPTVVGRLALSDYATSSSCSAEPASPATTALKIRPTQRRPAAPSAPPHSRAIRFPQAALPAAREPSSKVRSHQPSNLGRLGRHSVCACFSDDTSLTPGHYLSSVIVLPEPAGGRCCAQGWAWVVTARITRSGVAYLALPEMRSPKPRRDRV
jgi:hypothetical protein